MIEFFVVVGVLIGLVAYATWPLWIIYGLWCWLTAPRHSAELTSRQLGAIVRADDAAARRAAFPHQRKRGTPRERRAPEHERSSVWQ